MDLKGQFNTTLIDKILIVSKIVNNLVDDVIENTITNTMISELIDNLLLRVDYTYQFNNFIKSKKINFREGSQKYYALEYIKSCDLTKPIKMQDIITYCQNKKKFSDRKRSISLLLNETTNGLWDTKTHKNDKYYIFNPNLRNTIVNKSKIEPGTYFSDEVKKKVLERANFKCELCFNSFTEVESNIDHWIPRSKGGNGTLKNGVALCQQCNNMKKGKIPEESFKTFEKRFEEINKRVKNN